MQPIFEHLKERQLAGTCDEVALAGAIKALAYDPESGESQTLLKQIELSSKLHSIDTLILMNHTDCGGYGGRSAFDSPEAEREKHTADMHKVSDLLKEKFPNLDIKTVLADIQESGEVQFLEV